MTCHWDDEVLKGFDDRQLYDSIISYRKSMEEDWALIHKLLKIYSPQHFDLEKCTYEVYKHCSAFITSRCFGWGLPSTILVPIADSFNHSPKSNCIVDIVNKRLHLMQNKIYAYPHNFEGKGDAYDEEKSKLKYNVKKLYKEDITEE